VQAVQTRAPAARVYLAVGGGWIAGGAGAAALERKSDR
jgi:hypothetical protein